ncbi:MAG: alpha/beta fold hydrolase [Chloroflexi bacterium]|nr:alpha/beta fold hydrolase [Chloroflexota bacterium]
MSNPHVHDNQPVLLAGAALDDADVAVILLHGRGSSAQSILSLVDHLPQDRVAYLAPQAANHTWYPNSGFIALEANEPYVSSAFQMLADLVTGITDAGIPTNRIVLGGFSQGACLAAEFVARHPRRYGGLFVLSGALLGPPDLARQYTGTLDGTPVFIGGAGRDAWVTEQQLHLTGRELHQLGAEVRVEVQPGSEHTVRQTEIAYVNTMIAAA